MRNNRLISVGKFAIVCETDFMVTLKVKLKPENEILLNEISKNLKSIEKLHLENKKLLKDVIKLQA